MKIKTQTNYEVPEYEKYQCFVEGLKELTFGTGFTGEQAREETNKKIKKIVIELVSLV